ncbi:hypothetical protein CSKR_202193 [Clonorchis sinensis]|uniref:Granulins domain-containing protein n=1 Tax=Clonorchis sinensis TaxID=79923 RepID=A0A8T1LVU8_CLOSI|nr:hypothetical protein CSKR_202193 [Clonorchis sinensis]
MMDLRVLVLAVLLVSVAALPEHTERIPNYFGSSDKLARNCCPWATTLLCCPPGWRCDISPDICFPRASENEASDQVVPLKFPLGQ